MGIFKAYDIRGSYPAKLDETLAYNIGRAYVTFLSRTKPCKKVVVGRDMRLSSPALFDALSRGILDQGCDVVDIGLATTDMAYYSCYAVKADGGIMITASHNPKQDNGFKLFREKAIPLSEDTGIKEIGQLVRKGIFPKVSAEKRGKLFAKQMIPEFVKFVHSTVQIKKSEKNSSSLKVVVDCGNGMAGLVLKEMFKPFSLQLVSLYEELDGTFPHHAPNPLVEENRRDIVAKVQQEKADIGIAFDGDCDRCFFIDENGKYVAGDFILALLAKDVLKKQKGLVLYDVRSSWYVRDTVAQLGGRTHECRVGHAFMKRYVRDERAVLAGEVSGHYYYPFYEHDFVIDSGWITAMKVLSMLQREKKSLSQLLADAQGYYITGELNFTIKNADIVIKNLKKKYADAQQYEIDGLSIVYKDWHCNIRKSNTEPLLRLNLEAISKKLMEEKRREVEHLITNTKKA